MLAGNTVRAALPSQGGYAWACVCVIERGAMDGGAITWYISVYLMFIRVLAPSPPKEWSCVFIHTENSTFEHNRCGRWPRGIEQVFLHRLEPQHLLENILEVCILPSHPASVVGWQMWSSDQIRC